MSDPVKLEIIKRAKMAAVSHGSKVDVAHPLTYTLGLASPELGQVEISWIPDPGLLLVLLVRSEFGHYDRKHVLSLWGRIGEHAPDKTSWGFTEWNDKILAALKGLMLLDDLANV